MTMLRPYLSTAAVIFLAYRFLPDRGPSTASSLLSAALVALALEMEKVGLAHYIKQFQGFYEVVYGTLMFIPLMLAWLYLSWCLLLLGATLAATIDDVLGRRKPTILPPGPAA
jgi:membrane protein